jgi:hypothetical protein
VASRLLETAMLLLAGAVGVESAWPANSRTARRGQIHGMAAVHDMAVLSAFRIADSECHLHGVALAQ